MIAITNLTFSYPDHPVFTTACFELPDTGVVALRGPNGAGKTTLLKILGGLLACDNESVQQVRRDRRVVYLDQNVLSLSTLTVDEFFRLMCAELPLTLDARAGLLDDGMRSTRLGDLSLGQRQRCVLALGLGLRDVDLLLLDEPLNGLDAASVGRARAALLAAGRTSTVLIATHEPDDWTDADLVMSADARVVGHCVSTGGVR